MDEGRHPDSPAASVEPAGPDPGTSSSRAGPAAPTSRATSGAAPLGAPPPEHQRLLVRGTLFTIAMVAVGFAGTTAGTAAEVGPIVHLLRSVIVACFLGTVAGLIVLPVLAVRRRWRPWLRPALVATCLPAALLGLAALTARLGG